MTFDPFGDFATRGYLRNIAGEKDSEIVKRLEHTSFVTGVEEAFAFLAKKDVLSYGDVLDVHRILFGAVYPWAGQDRLTTAPALAINKGPVLFAHPQSIERAINYALKRGNDPEIMRQKPGDVMGYLAYGHPFLDGNGRTIMVVHTVLAERAGISIDWSRTDKDQYLRALTLEIENPGKGHLDTFLAPYVSHAIGELALASHVAAISGLDSSRESIEENQVAGSINDPALRAQYEQQELKYQQAQMDDEIELARDRGGRER